MKSADVVVIGAGPGGYVAAIRAAQLGKSVICIEREYVGGVCLNVGCIPSKAMINAGKVLHKVDTYAEMGIDMDGVSVDINRLVDWKQKVVDRLTGGVSFLFKHHNVEHVVGEATFQSATTLSVDTPDGEITVEGKDIIIATGSRPIELGAFPVDGETVLGSTECLAIDEIPKRVLVIGGGYIGLELGTFLRHLGVEVIVVEATDGLLPGQDRELVKVVARNLKKKKVQVLTDSFAQGFEKLDDGGVRVTVDSKKKGTITFDVDWVLSTVGRRPNSEDLGLEAIGVEIENGFVKIDEQCRTSVPNVYAIGDVAGQPMLAHKASREGVVAAGAIAGQPTACDWRAVPAVIFTDPEIASVGLTEEQATAAGYEIKVGKFQFRANGRALSLSEPDGFAKIVTDASNDVVLGVHIVGAEATELIAEGGLAIEMGARAEDIASTIHAHPTLPEVLAEAAEAVHGLQIHAV